VLDTKPPNSDEGVDRAGRVAHDDDRGLANGGADGVAGLGEFHREAEVVRVGPFLEQPLLLVLLLYRVGVGRKGTSLMPFDGQRLKRTGTWGRPSPGRCVGERA